MKDYRSIDATVWLTDSDGASMFHHTFYNYAAQLNFGLAVCFLNLAFSEF